MSSPRSLVQALEKAKNESGKSALDFVAAKSQALSDQATRTRIFDDIDNVLSSTKDFKGITRTFKEVALKGKAIRTADDKFIISSDYYKRVLIDMLKYIAQQACRELLTEKGTIQASYKKYLGWKQPLTQAETCDIVMAYVNKVNQEVIVAAQGCLTDIEMSQAIFHYINQQCRSATLAVMQDNDQVFDQVAFDTCRHLNDSKFSITNKMILGAGITAAAFTLSVAAKFVFFKGGSSSYAPELCEAAVDALSHKFSR